MKNKNNNNKEKRHCGCYKEPRASEGTGILIAIAIKYPEWLNRKTNHVLPKIRLFVRNWAWLKSFCLKAPISSFHNVCFYCTTEKYTLNELLLIYPNVLNYSIIMIGLRFHVADYSWSNFFFLVVSLLYVTLQKILRLRVIGRATR